MYQFMVATRSGTNVRPGNSTWIGPGTEIGDVSTMSLTSGTNKWASRAVVALQLAAWSAVGIVLLEKGVTSLQKNSNTFNVSHEQIRSTQSADMMIADQNIEEKQNGRNLSPNEAEYRTGLFSVIPLVIDDENPATSRSTSTQMMEEKLHYKNKNNRFDDDEKIKVDEDSVTIRGNFAIVNNNPAMGNSKEETTEGSTEEDSRWKNRKRSRFAKVGAGGAAAAVAMVAVGAVMLVLGPAVILLRALDERRQERRFLKLSGEEDLPPSYEQATSNCGDQAPTYSSLNLDTIDMPLQSASSPALQNNNNNNSTCLRDSRESSTPS